MLSIRNVVKVYGTGSAAVTALRGISLDVPEGGFVLVAGRSGSGKSTLLHLLGGLDRPTSGEVLFQDAPISRWSEEGLARWRRRHVGFMFQEPFLLPHLSARENVALPLRYRGVPVRAQMAAAAEMLERVGLVGRTAHRPGQLSGGEAQRAALARALVGKPTVVLADEPTGDLDSVSAGALGELLMALHREERITFVVVTHDPVLLGLGLPVVELSDGMLADSPGPNPSFSSRGPLLR